MGGGMGVRREDIGVQEGGDGDVSNGCYARFLHYTAPDGWDGMLLVHLGLGMHAWRRRLCY